MDFTYCFKTHHTNTCEKNCFVSSRGGENSMFHLIDLQKKNESNSSITKEIIV